MPELLIRIVTMTFRPDCDAAFLRLFDTVSDRIRAYPGCRHLTLLRDVDEPARFTTYSIWESPGHLDEYRSSALFEQTWRETKRMFAKPPVATSYVVERSDEAITSRQPPTEP